MQVDYLTWLRTKERDTRNRGYSVGASEDDRAYFCGIANAYSEAADEYGSRIAQLALPDNQPYIQFSDLDELLAQLECDATRVRKAADFEMYKGRRRGLLGHHAGMQEAIRTVKAFRDSYLTIDREQE